METKIVHAFFNPFKKVFKAHCKCQRLQAALSSQRNVTSALEKSHLKIYVFFDVLSSDA